MLAALEIQEGFLVLLIGFEAHHGLVHHALNVVYFCKDTHIKIIKPHGNIQALGVLILGLVAQIGKMFLSRLLEE